MQVNLIHDLSIQQLQSGFASEINGFFFGSYWYVNKPSAYSFVRDIASKGGLKKAFNINEKVIYEHGADRLVQTKSTDKKRMFLRPPLTSLQEAVAFKPDVIQIMDLPLEDKDDESRICEKLAINHDIVVDYEEWLIKNGLRSSSRYKNGVRKFSRFMLLGVAHGDAPDAYADEAKFMMGHCEIIGVPLAGLLSRIPTLSMAQRYAYMRKVIENVLNVVGDTRIVQLMGYGISRISELSGLLSLASNHDATLWFESSTIIRNSSHARKILSLSPKSPDRLEYINISRVKGAEGLSALDVFRQNDKILKNILSKATKGGKIGRTLNVSDGQTQ